MWVPILRKDEFDKLAATGALNSLDAKHRRDALWKANRAVRPSGPLLEFLPEGEISEPLRMMNIGERLTADYLGTGINIGKHPMAHRREEMNALGVTPAIDLSKLRAGKIARIAGNVIVRQRPGTAEGLVFLTMEDETGIANVVIMPDVFDQEKLTIIRNTWLLIEGPIQNHDNVVHVRAQKITA